MKNPRLSSSINLKSDRLLESRYFTKQAMPRTSCSRAIPITGIIQPIAPIIPQSGSVVFIVTELPVVSMPKTRGAAAQWHHGRAHIVHPAQQDNCVTSLVKVWAQSLSPSTMVR